VSKHPEGICVFHLIGVAHRVQSVGTGDQLNNDQNRLSNCLSHLVEQVNLAVIAEEQSLEGLGTSLSIPQRIAEKAGIEHRFCDPDSKQRVAMGYRDRHSIWEDLFASGDSWNLSSPELDAKAGAIEMVRYFPMREKVWLERLADHAHSEVAFVCGNAHIEGFTKLLNESGIPSRIVDRGIGVNDEDRYLLETTLAYLEKHPELGKWR
jgi:hypothetical protein